MGTTEKVSRVMSAVNALAGLEGACVEVRPESEAECADLAKLLGGFVSGHACIFPQSAIGVAHVDWIYSFAAARDGVGIRGQNTRPATPEEIVTANVHDPKPTTDRERKAALSKIESAKKAVKRDEFSCPCCGTPTDSSYCDACDKAECGEQHVDAPHKCLVEERTAA